MTDQPDVVVGRVVDEGDVPGMAASLRARLRQLAEASTFIVLAIILWQVVVWVFDPADFLLPDPIDVWHSIWASELGWIRNGWVTLQEVLGGFVVGSALGIALGLIVSWSRILSRTVLPALVLFNTLPKVAVAPLFIIYFGFGILPNIAISALVVFFPVVLNMTQGLNQTSPELLDLARTLGANRRRVFRLLRVPNSVPYLMVGLRIAAPLAVTGAVFGEFVASQAGLGNMIISTQTNLNMHHAFAALFWLAIIGLPLFAVVDWGGRVLFPWASGQAEE